jgi:hypothetical protein
VGKDVPTIREMAEHLKVTDKAVYSVAEQCAAHEPAGCLTSSYELKACPEEGEGHSLRVRGLFKEWLLRNASDLVWACRTILH